MFQPLTHATISRLRAGALVAAIAALAHAAPGGGPGARNRAVSADDATEILETAAATVAPAHAPNGRRAGARRDARPPRPGRRLPGARTGRAPARRRPCSRGRPTAPATRCDDGYPPAAPIASAESEHFCVFWVNSASFGDAPSLDDPDADAVPDYVELLLEIAECSYGVEVAPGPLGWEPPKRDLTGCGANPGTRSDIYLKQLGNRGLFGYQSVDPGQGRARSQYGYMVLDDDYARSEYGYDDPAIPASVTFAHEFNHLLQANYDIFQDLWMNESTATWAEEKVYPDADDYVGYAAVLRQVPGRADHRDLPPGCHQVLADLRRRRLEPLARRRRRRLRLGRHPPCLGALRRHQSARLRARPPTTARSSETGARASAASSLAFAAATAEWRSGFGGFPDRRRVSGCQPQGLVGEGRQAAASSSTTPPIAC